MSIRSKQLTATAVTVVAAAAAIGTTAGPGAASAGKNGGLPQGSEKVKLKPSDFTTRITNPYWPMRPGSRWVYRETDPDGTKQRTVVTVTNRTKRIANGVRARVVSDVVTAGATPIETTEDYYAQDKRGNIWYLGEFTKEYENGKVKSTAGSFEAGVKGAQPGIAVPAKPRPGLRYRQEYYKGHAEDNGKVVSVKEQAEVPFGHFKRVLMTRDTNPLEPRNVEFKFYARGVGPVLAVATSGGSDREELLSYVKGK